MRVNHTHTYIELQTLKDKLFNMLMKITRQRAHTQKNCSSWVAEFGNIEDTINHFDYQFKAEAQQ